MGHSKTLIFEICHPAVEADIVSKELADGTWIAFIKGRIITPLAIGKTAEKAKLKLLRYVNG